MLTLLLLAVALPAPGQAVLAPPAARGLPTDHDRSAWSDSARWMPAETALYVALPGLPSWLAGGLDHPEVAALLAHPLAQLALTDAPLTPAEAVALLDGLAGRPVLPTLARLAERGLGLGLVPGPRPGAKPRPFIVVQGDDADLLEEVLEEAFDVLAARSKIDRRLLDAPHTEVDGAVVHRLGDELALARSGATLVLAANVDDVVLALEAAKGGTPSLASDERFVAARATAGRAPFAWLFVDLAALAAADLEARANLAAVAAGPAAHFLLGPSLTYLSRAEALGVALHVDGALVRVALEALGVDAGPGAATFPRAPQPAQTWTQRDATVERNALVALVHRDMAALTALRATLFPPQLQPAFAKTLADLTPLLGGLDLYDDVLPAVSPWLHIVARSVEFEAGAAPLIELPAACIVARVPDEAVAEALVSAFQTTIGIVNIEASQQQRAALRLDLALVDGVTMTRARYPRPRSVDAAGAPVPVDVRYNLAPGCALVGEHFVLGTHHALVAEVVRELATGTPNAAAGDRVASATDHIALRGEPLAALLRANRETLTLNAVLVEGKPRARAEAELEALAALLASCERIELTAEAQEVARDDAPVEGGAAKRRISIELTVRLSPEDVAAPK